MKFSLHTILPLNFDIRAYRTENRRFNRVPIDIYRRLLVAAQERELE